jgi:hypothetical protein
VYASSVVGKRRSLAHARVAASAGLALASVLAAVACGSAYGTSADPASTNGLGDASAPSDEAGPTDAGAHDASADGTGPGVAPFCATHAADPGLVYCNDFEVPTQATPPYGFTDVSGGPSPSGGISGITVVGDGARRAVLQAAVSGSASTMRDNTLELRQVLVAGQTLPSLQIDLDLNIVANDVPSMTLAAIHAAGASCEASWGLGAFDGDTIGGTRTRDVTLRPVVLGEWQHVTIALLVSPASTTGYREVTTYAGTGVVDRDARASSGAAPGACTSIDLTIGVIESGTGAQNVTLRFDNILVRRLN